MSNSRDLIRQFIFDSLKDLTSFEPKLEFCYTYDERKFPQIVIQMTNERKITKDDEGGAQHLAVWSVSFDIYFVKRMQKQSDSVQLMDEEINEWIERIKYRIMRANNFDAIPTDDWYDASTKALTFYISGINLNTIQPVAAYDGEITMILFSGTVGYNTIININT